MTDSQIDSWAKAIHAFLVFEARVGGTSKYATAFEVKDLIVWARAQLEKSDPFEYWLVTVKNENNRRSYRSFIQNKTKNELFEMAEICLNSFEKLK